MSPINYEEASNYYGITQADQLEIIPKKPGIYAWFHHLPYKNDNKETFLDDMENEKRRIQRDMQDEINWQRKYGRDFGMNPEMEDGHMMEDPMETRRKIKKVRRNPLRNLRNVQWNPYDKTLIAKKGKWRLDHPPDDEDEE